VQVPHTLPVLATVLLSPVYRGRVTAADPSPIVARSRIRVESATTVALHAALLPAAAEGGQPLVEQDLGPYSVDDTAIQVRNSSQLPSSRHFSRQAIVCQDKLRTNERKTQNKKSAFHTDG
jgi:hypothetical protein